MKREQTISREDRTLASDIMQPAANEPVESGSKRFQSPANLFKRVIRRPELRKIVPLTADAVTWIEQHNASGASPRVEMWAESHLERLLAARPAVIAEFGLRGH